MQKYVFNEDLTAWPRWLGFPCQQVDFVIEMKKIEALQTFRRHLTSCWNLNRLQSRPLPRQDTEFLKEFENFQCNIVLLILAMAKIYHPLKQVAPPRRL
jgi:hypothetical protein